MRLFLIGLEHLRTCSGFPLELSDALQILKKMGYLENAPFPPNVSYNLYKRAFLERHLAIIFPHYDDHFIRTRSPTE
jgi:hypothetical protein